MSDQHAEYERWRQQRILDGKICGTCGEWPEFCDCLPGEDYESYWERVTKTARTDGEA